MRILLLSAYDAASHQRWRQGLVHALPEHDWTLLTLPPRHFSWRIRGNPLSWMFSQQSVFQQSYDVVLATSMTDIVTLRGLFPALALSPTIVYFHENQFVYPFRHSHERDWVHLGMHHIYNALCADRIAFNSHFNHETFLSGVQQLLQRMPDHVPTNVCSVLASKSVVLPVPLEDSFFVPRSTPVTGPFSILWNHRWEYDKAPERFFDALLLLREQGIDFHVHVVGQQFRQQPECFADAKQTLASHIRSWGYVPSREDYLGLLRSCDVVVSTALHEFQGLALLEASASGCLPVAPDRLAYRDWVPASCRYASFPEDADAESREICSHLRALASECSTLRQQPALSLSHLSWSGLLPAYRELLCLPTTRLSRGDGTC